MWREVLSEPRVVIGILGPNGVRLLSAIEKARLWLRVLCPLVHQREGASFFTDSEEPSGV